MPRPKKTPLQAAIVAYVNAAAKAAWTNEDFTNHVVDDFGVTYDSAKGLLLAASFGRPEAWLPQRG